MHYATIVTYIAVCFFFFFNDTATTEIYTLSLRDALPISSHGLSGVHALFLDEPARAACAQRGWLLRRDCQFHWCNRGYTSETDRKSTRLNSSHSQISYAVFCLKKKKKLQYRDGEHIDYRQ